MKTLFLFHPYVNNGMTDSLMAVSERIEDTRRGVVIHDLVPERPTGRLAVVAVVEGEQVEPVA